MQQLLAQAPQGVCCLTSSWGEVLLRPSIVVGLQSLRSVSFRCLQWRWPGYVMTRLLVRLVGGFPSSAATVLPVLPLLQLCAGNSSTPGPQMNSPSSGYVNILILALCRGASSNICGSLDTCERGGFAVWPLARLNARRSPKT